MDEKGAGTRLTVGSLDDWSAAGAPQQRPCGVEDLFLGDLAAQGEGKSERRKYPGGVKYRFVCYTTFWVLLFYFRMTMPLNLSFKATLNSFPKAVGCK